MPTQEFLSAIKEVRTGLGGIIDLASTFAVSIQSAALRHTALSRKPTAIVMFRDAGKPWWDISPELKAQGYNWIQRMDRDAIPVDSATGMALRDSAASLGPLHQTGTLASAWFTGVFQGSKYDQMFLESAVRLRSRGVLTFLEPHIVGGAG